MILAKDRYHCWSPCASGCSCLRATSSLKDSSLIKAQLLAPLSSELTRRHSHPVTCWNANTFPYLPFLRVQPASSSTASEEESPSSPQIAYDDGGAIVIYTGPSPPSLRHKVTAACIHVEEVKRGVLNSRQRVSLDPTRDPEVLAKDITGQYWASLARLKCKTEMGQSGCVWY